MQAFLSEEHSLEVSESTMTRVLQRMKYTRKVVCRHACIRILYKLDPAPGTRKKPDSTGRLDSTVDGVDIGTNGVC